MGEGSDGISADLSSLSEGNPVRWSRVLVGVAAFALLLLVFVGYRVFSAQPNWVGTERHVTFYYLRDEKNGDGLWDAVTNDFWCVTKGSYPPPSIAEWDDGIIHSGPICAGAIHYDSATTATFVGDASDGKPTALVTCRNGRAP